MKRFVIFLFGLVVITFIVVLLNWDFVFKSSVAEGLVIKTKSKIEKEGVVFERFFGGGKDYYPVITYNVDGRVYNFYGPENIYKEGDTIEVRYLSETPKKAKVNTLFGIFFNEKLVLPVILLIVWAAFVFSFIRR